MKKYISFLILILFLFNTSYSQNYADSGGGSGAACSCTVPNNSTCSANCLFSDCCICWNPSTQTGACGCYWGVATCKNQNNSTNSTISSNNFGELNPNAKIRFFFEKFNLLFDYFKSKEIKTEALQNSFLNIRAKYVLTGKKIDISNSDFAQILSEYSKLIDALDLNQKEQLNIYIKSLN